MQLDSFLYFFFFLLFFETGSPYVVQAGPELTVCHPGWPQTCGESPATASQVPASQVCAMIPG